MRGRLIYLFQKIHWAKRSSVIKRDGAFHDGDAVVIIIIYISPVFFHLSLSMVSVSGEFNKIYFK